MNMEQLKSLNRALAEAEAGFESRLRAFSDQLQQLQQALQREEARATSLSQEGIALQGQVQELQSALVATREQAQAEAATYQAETRRLQTEIDGLYVRLAAVQTDAAQRDELWRAQVAQRTEEAQGARAAADAARLQHEAQLMQTRKELQDARETLVRRLAEVTAEARAGQRALEAQLGKLTQARQGLSDQLEGARADNAQLRTLADSERSARQVEAARADEQAAALRQQCLRAEDALRDLRAQAAATFTTQEASAERASARLVDLGAALARLESRLAQQDMAHGRERKSLQELTATAQGHANSATAEADRQRQAHEASLSAAESLRTADLMRHAEERRQLKAEHEQAQMRCDQRERQHAEAQRSLQSALRQSEQQARSLVLAVERLERRLAADPQSATPSASPASRAWPTAPAGPTSPAPFTPAEPAAEAPPALAPPPSARAEPRTSHDSLPASSPAETAPMDIEHVNQLLSFRGGDFVTQAYRVVLGREPDPQGLAHFQRRAETRHDKAAIVCELALSREGRARPPPLDGLAELVQLHTPREGRVKRWLQRLALGIAATHRVEVAIDHLGAQTEERLRSTEARLASLDARVARQSAQLAAQADQTQRTREELLGVTRELARCAQGLAALPLELATLQQNLQSQMESLFAAYAAPAPAPMESEPSRASALNLHVSAADGPARFLEDLTQALASSDEAARLASRPAA